MGNNNDNNLKQELELRIKSLEDEQEKSHRFFKHTLTAITSIFIFVGVLLTVLSLFSKKEISDATREMERKFEVLSNQALIKPKLEIFYNGQPISGNTLTIEDYSNLTIPLDKISINNIGSKSAQDISINIHLSKNLVSVITTDSGYFDTFDNWEESKSFIKGYETLLKFKEKVSLNPGEYWNHAWVIEFEKNHLNKTDSMTAKFLIYYGVDKPLECTFVLKRAKKDK